MSNPKKYQAVGFDYSGVVAGISGREFNANVCRILNIDMQAYRNAYFKINHLLNTNALSPEAFWKLFLENTSKSERYEELMNYINGLSAHSINQDVVTLADRLKNNGYKVGLFSNNTSEGAERIRKNLAGHFHAIVVSSEIGHIKPTPESFNIFFNQLGVRPGDSIFIDDEEKSLDSAMVVGFTPIVFDNYPKLIHDLASLGITFG